MTDSGDDTGSSGEEKVVRRGAVQRLGNMEWCRCGWCNVMPTVVDSLCCCDMRENDELDRVDCTEVNCITQHGSFNTVCLEREVLRTALVCMSDVVGETGPESLGNRSALTLASLVCS